ncbi:MAG: hypothetical protein ACTHJ8_08215, partial [Mucilaginibacter sp.]
VNILCHENAVNIHKPAPAMRVYVCFLLNSSAVKAGESAAHAPGGQRNEDGGQKNFTIISASCSFG